MRTRPRSLYKLASIGLITASIGFNKWILAWVLRRKIEFSDATQVNIAVFEALLLIGGLVCWDPSRIQQLVTTLKQSAAVRYLTRPLSDPAMWLSLLPIMAISFTRQMSGWVSSTFHWWHPAALVVIIQGMLVSGFFVTGIAALAHRAVGKLWLPVLVGVGFALVSTVDSAFILYSKMRLSWSLMHASIGATSIYADPLIVTGACFFFAAAIVASWLTVRSDAARGQNSGIQRCAWAGVILLLQPALVFVRIVTAPIPATNRASIETHYDEASRYGLNPLLDLAWSAFSEPTGRVVTSLESKDAALLRPFRGAPATLVVQPLVRPMKRIVLVTMESMSMSLTSRYNPKMPGELTPVIDSLPASAENFRGVSTPTSFGLASHLCSHPNGRAALNTGHLHALPAYLSRHGRKTCFMQSATLQFQAGARRFREMGYQELYGRDEAKDDPRYSNYISDWGLCDRKVYERAVDWLSAHREESVFLHILTADTHSPSGRLDWHGLPYPPTPDWIGRTGRPQLYLQSWFRADHDLGLFLGQLRSAGLLDEDTAVVVTGDHTCPGGPIYTAIPGSAQEAVERIPWIFISPREFAVDRSRLSSQIDTAPTIAQLAGLPSESNWWGISLLVRAASRPQLAWRDRRAVQVDLDGTTKPMAVDVQRLGWVLESASADRSTN